MPTKLKLSQINQTIASTVVDNPNAIATKGYVTSNYVPLNGGTLSGAITIRKDNGSGPSSYGILLTGGAQNHAICIQNTNVTKGTAPASTVYSGVDFYGNTNISSYTHRLGVLEQSVNSSNLSSMSMIANGLSSATDTTTCTISCFVDSSGNAYTAAPTPATSDNSTKIATTAYVKDNLDNYLPLSGGTMTGDIYNGKLTDFLRIQGYSENNKGARLSLAGKDHPSMPGEFYLVAADGTRNASLVGAPSGSLTWGGSSFKIGSGCTLSYNSTNKCLDFIFS